MHAVGEEEVAELSRDSQQQLESPEPAPQADAIDGTASAAADRATMPADTIGWKRRRAMVRFCLGKISSSRDAKCQHSSCLCRHPVAQYQYAGGE